jgi:hypothetical protein
MSARTRSRILRIVVIVAVIAVAREVSVRRHEADLHDWPSDDDGPATS